MLLLWWLTIFPICIFLGTFYRTQLKLMLVSDHSLVLRINLSGAQIPVFISCFSTRPQSPHSNLPHSPNSVLSAVDALKPVSDHYLGQGQSPLPAPLAHAHSSTSHSQPPTRPASPVCNSLPPSPQSNARQRPQRDL